MLLKFFLLLDKNWANLFRKESCVQDMGRKAGSPVLRTPSCWCHVPHHDIALATMACPKVKEGHVLENRSNPGSECGNVP